MIHDYQKMQYYGSFVVDTPSDEMNVLYDTGSSSLGVPISDCYNGIQVTISTAVADQTYASPTPAHSDSSLFGSSVKLLFQGHCKWCWSINRKLHFHRGE